MEESDFFQLKIEVLNFKLEFLHPANLIIAL